MKTFLYTTVVIATVIGIIFGVMHYLGISISMDSVLGKKQKYESVIDENSFKQAREEQEKMLAEMNANRPKKKTVRSDKVEVKAYNWDRKFVLALDSGYSIKDPGMAGVRGKREVEYNDRFVNELVPKIEEIGWEVKLVRGDHDYISDKHRAAQTNLWGADLLLSIHHDVSPPEHTEQKIIEGKTANVATKSFEGFSMYVSPQNRKFRQSTCFAQRLGFRLKPMQRNPAYFHKETENLNWVIKEYAIFERDIPLLSQTEIPAVQLKIGVITDIKDEAWMNDGQYREDVEAAIVKTLRVFKQYCS